MAIIEKPTGPTEVFATPEEALRQEPVMEISVSDFNERLANPEVQATLQNARTKQDDRGEVS